jgi:dephospho-CoA kinase
VPLLVESGKRWRSQVDRVLLIDCTVQLQIERVMARNGLSKAAVEQIIQAQAPRSAKLAAADWVIYNESKSFEDLHAKVLSLPLQKPHA